MLESKQAQVADKMADVNAAEKAQNEVVKQVGVLEKQLQDEKKKMQTTTEALERIELDFMNDLVKLETKITT